LFLSRSLRQRLRHQHAGRSHRLRLVRSVQGPE
jgi:hypothetical protein